MKLSEFIRLKAAENRGRKDLADKVRSLESTSVTKDHRAVWSPLVVQGRKMMTRTD